MATENSRRIPIDNAATFDEVTEAISFLTKIQLKQIEKYARWRINGLGRHCNGRNWEDLVNETIASFLEACASETGRRWNKEKVDFLKALTEAMRSISDSWRRSFNKDEEPFLEAELITTSLSGEESNKFEKLVSPNWNTQKTLENKEKLKLIDELVSERELASLIILGMKDKMTGTEIREDLNISKTQYETEMTWIRRKIRPVFKEQTKC
jgi:hypothetical protein